MMYRRLMWTKLQKGDQAFIALVFGNLVLQLLYQNQAKFGVNAYDILVN